MYGPAKTLGAPEDVQMAMDAQLAESGVYSLLQHTLEMGMGVAPQFMGYAALQNIAQNGLIRACIETVADDMTRAWIEFKREGEGGENGDEGEALLTDLAQAVKRFELQRHFHEAAELVGYEGGAFIFIDTGVAGDLLAHPLNLSRFSGELRPGGSLRFVVVDPVNVFPGDYNSLSPLRPDYFKPGWWWVLGQRVHASRLIRLTANEVPVLLRPTYNFLGIPQAQILWDYVLHFQECRAAEARLLTKFSLTVFKTKMDDILFASGGTAELDARIRYMIQSMSNDGVLAVDKESEDVIKLETPLSGVTDIVRQSLEILAALNRTPAVKLLGISPSGFNATGESDIRNYYDHISSQQEKVLRDGVKKALDCIQLHLRGKIDPSITFDFAPLGEEDRAALSAYQKTKADTIAVYMDRDIISPEEARKVLADDPDSGFAGIDPDDVPEGNGMPGDLPTGGEEGELGDPDIDDVDKAGAVYDVAQDAEIWRTSKGGKRFQVDTETGEVVKETDRLKKNPPNADSGPFLRAFGGSSPTADSSKCLPGINRIMREEIGCGKDSMPPLFEIVNLRFADEGINDLREAVDEAFDDRWITVKPNGPNNTGRPALIGENGEIKAGMGGKFNGQKIDSLKRSGETRSSMPPGTNGSQNLISPKGKENTGTKAREEVEIQTKEPGENSRQGAFSVAAIKPEALKGGLAHATGQDALVVAYLRASSPQKKAEYKSFFESDPIANREGKKIEDFIKEYDRGFSKSKAQTTLYRGMMLSQESLDNILKNGNISDKAPISTTGTRSVAQSYLDGSRASKGNKKGVLLVIDTPKGTKALDLVAATKDARAGNPFQSPWGKHYHRKTQELDEVLLARGTSLKITRHENNPDGTVTIYVTPEKN